MIAKRRPTAGFTLIEMLVSVAIVGTLLAGLSQALMTSSGAYRSGATIMELESRGARVFGRIVHALRSARIDSVTPNLAAPASAEQISFQVAEGFDGAAIQLSDPRDISYLAQTGEIVLTESTVDPDSPRTILGRGVPPLLEGELANNLDDNGNGLIDEPGLCFSVAGDVITVRMSVRSTGPQPVTRTFEARVNCRN